MLGERVHSRSNAPLNWCITIQVRTPFLAIFLANCCFSNIFAQPGLKHSSSAADTTGSSLYSPQQGLQMSPFVPQVPTQRVSVAQCRLMHRERGQAGDICEELIRIH